MCVELTTKTKKLLAVLAASGFHHIEDLARASVTETECPAICLTEGCDHIAPFEKDQDSGICEACGGATMTSALVLADVI